MFRLHSRLQADTLFIGDLPLCRLLAIDDASYPWFLLVPRRAEITEIYQLSPKEQQLLLQESSLLSEVLIRTFAADKLNIAALGNIVPQLHLHHIVRYHGDPAWPGPVWGQQPAQPYLPADAARLVEQMRQQFPGLDTEGAD